MKVAIVHDYLTQRGGAERVVLSMLKAWPQAPIYTSLYEPGQCFPAFRDADVRPLFLNRVGPIRRHHRIALPFLAPAFSRLRVPADVVICSSSGWSHGIKTSGRKIVYCYTPARWLYQPERYLRDANPLAKASLQLLGPGLRKWDRRAAATADGYLAISTVVRERILELYGIEAGLLPPPHTLDPDGPRQKITDVDAGFFLCVSRLLPYKNIDSVIQSFRTLPAQQLVVVGTGPDRLRLQGMAPNNVRFLGAVSDEQLRWLYSQCRALVAAAYEDLGLTPLEAAAFGKPSVVLRWGGFLDTVNEQVNGVFFERPDSELISEALKRVSETNFEPGGIKSHAAQFSEQNFVSKLKQLVDDYAVH